MKEHLHSWRFYLGWAIGYDIKEILHTAQIYDSDFSYLVSLSLTDIAIFMYFLERKKNPTLITVMIR